MEEKRFPPLPPTLQELDEAYAALTGRSTLTNSREGYEAVQAALDGEFPDRPLKKIDPAITAIEQLPIARLETEAPAESGRLNLGKTISDLYEELKHLRTFAKGRRKTESELRSHFSNFQLWKEIDDSESLPELEKQRFFKSRLDSHGQAGFMDFIGRIVALEGATAYKIWKEYRNHAGLKRKRSASKATSKSLPKHRS
jgi:hypothetical protein